MRLRPAPRDARFYDLLTMTGAAVHRPESAGGGPCGNTFEPTAPH